MNERSSSRKPRIIPIVPHGKTAVASGSGLEFRHALPLALYVHIPWCVQKCPYCDFNSHEARGEIPEADYISALIADLESSLPLIWGRTVSSIFFGGGTPSLLSGAGLDRLLTAIRTLLPLLPDAEVTLEANPGTVESAKFAAFRAAGINRLSLGIQSFNPAHLKALGRIHDGEDARRAIEIATAHFDNFNLDLMYGLPGQTLEEALSDVETALAFAPTHLSCYQLTLEPNTAFAAAPPVLPDPDRCADMQEAIEDRLAAASFAHYETSAFAQHGRQCRHNLNYWTFGDYLGIGAGAHGKLTLYDGKRWEVRRQMRWKQPKQYLAQIAQSKPIQEEFSVEMADLPFEFMMNALRLNQGFEPELFEMRTSLPLFAIENELRQAETQGLIERQPQRIAPTRQGQRFLNRLLETFIAERD
ncbi:MAG: oxygen-independent coproporphyrinogen III oxidase-like protein [Propionivibrio sp.]|jgi:oxygen-independent coproporphyrinogen-3 oxidase|nr:oxygen-independent coproporphyrinogen III oxidase-like protein [Propionivibrio sp.]MBP7524977.1 oxygen-independent coproporphyrinogen III oxidase-like protein [Propionivibrio sp.]